MADDAWGTVGNMLMSGGAAAAPMTGGMSLLASGLGAGINYFSQQQTNAKQQQLSQQQQQFQENMSNTAYQRSVADMEKAGLNPAMMFGHGEAASSPQGAPASLRAPQVDTDLVDRAIATANNKMVAEATSQNLVAEAGKNVAQKVVLEKEPERIGAEINEIIARTNLTDEERKRMILRLPIDMLDSAAAQAVIRTLNPTAFDYMATTKWGAGALAEALSVGMKYAPKTYIQNRAVEMTGNAAKPQASRFDPAKGGYYSPRLDRAQSHYDKKWGFTK